MIPQEMTACKFIYNVCICVFICLSVRTNKQYPVDCSLSLPCHGLVVGHGHL